MNSEQNEKVPTGVPGLDHILGGGYLREGFYLIQGDPGSGKTTVALQFVLSRAAAGEKCLYVSLTESARDFDKACRSHGWNRDVFELCDLTRASANLSKQAGASIFHPSDTELGDTTRAIISAVEKSNPDHVVFDGLSELRLLTGNALLYRRQLLSLKEFFAARGTTVLLLDDQSSPMATIQPESLVGGNIVFERTLPQYGAARRRMYVSKVRGSDFRDGYHDYEIVRGGLIIHPRLVAAEHHDRFSEKMSESGIEHLDAMLHGGLSAGSTALMLGPAGVGKSTITMQFVASALKKGRKAAVYVFDEVLGTLFERTDKLCLGEIGGLRKYVADGLLHAQQVDPAEMTPGAFAHEVRRSVEAGAEIVVIDSMNGYLNAMPEERFLTAHLHEMFAYLNQKGITTIMVVAQHGMVMSTASTSEQIDVSYLADTVLLFRYFETRGEIMQAVSVMKKRTGPHDRSLRQLVISSKGVQVGSPLDAFRGIMTGVPTYEGETPMLPPKATGEQG